MFIINLNFAFSHLIIRCNIKFYGYLLVYKLVFLLLLSGNVTAADLSSRTLDFLKLSKSSKLPEKKALWIEAEGIVRPLNDPNEFNKLLNTLNAYSFTDVYVQIYRNGKSWFPSKYSDTSPYESNRKIDFDPINKLLEFSKVRGIRVHAWMNVLRMGEGAPFLQKVGSSAVLHDAMGRSLLDTQGKGVAGCRPDTPGIWLDPNHREVRRNTLRIIKELSSLYPDLSGIHFDYIRYPFPYANEGEQKEAYCKEFINEKEFKRREQQRASLSYSSSRETKLQSDDNIDPNEAALTYLLTLVRKYVNLRAPHLEVSSAVLSNFERAKKHGKQNWQEWLRLGLLDSVVTMNYTTDLDRFIRESKIASDLSKGKVMIGLGAWLSLSKPETLYQSLKSIRDIPKEGVVLFSYANLSNESGRKLFEHLDNYPYR